VIWSNAPVSGGYANELNFEAVPFLQAADIFILITAGETRTPSPIRRIRSRAKATVSHRSPEVAKKGLSRAGALLWWQQLRRLQNGLRFWSRY
jgi:hypothetical protein